MIGDNHQRINKSKIQYGRWLSGIGKLVITHKLRDIFIRLVDYLKALEDEISQMVDEIGPPTLMVFRGGLHAK